MSTPKDTGNKTVKRKKSYKKGEAIKGAWIMYCQAIDIGIGAPYNPELFPKQHLTKKEI